MENPVDKLVSAVFKQHLELEDLAYQLKGLGYLADPEGDGDGWRVGFSRLIVGMGNRAELIAATLEEIKVEYHKGTEAYFQALGIAEGRGVPHE